MVTEAQSTVEAQQRQSRSNTSNAPSLEMGKDIAKARLYDTLRRFFIRLFVSLSVCLSLCLFRVLENTYTSHRCTFTYEVLQVVLALPSKRLLYNCFSSQPERG